jgi:hypothetical protein
MIDTILFPLLLSIAQITSGCTDSYTTNLCIQEGERIGLQVYESNRLYTIPFGDQPSLTNFILSDIISITVMWGIGWLIRKTSLHDVWYFPQVSLISCQICQSIKNYELYERIKTTSER